jgi:hypothetical protein
VHCFGRHLKFVCCLDLERVALLDSEGRKQCVNGVQLNLNTLTIFYKSNSGQICEHYM